MGKSYRKHKRGGAGAASPSSYSDAASFMKATVGSGNQQYNNVFDMGKQGNHSNAIVGLQGQKAGRRRSRSKKGGSKRKKGGFWGHVINQAIVPFSILGMQQSYRRKRSGGSKTKRHRRR
jgi:hypothetical protein